MRRCPPGDACTVRMIPREIKMNKAAWDTQKAKGMWQAGFSDKDIAAEVGTTAASISYYRRKHWVEDPPRKECRLMAQKNATPTRLQSWILERNGLDAKSWSVMKDMRNRLIIRNRITGEVRWIGK